MTRPRSHPHWHCWPKAVRVAIYLGVASRIKRRVGQRACERCGRCWVIETTNEGEV